MKYLNAIHKLTGRQMTVVKIVREFEILYVAPSPSNDYTVKVYTEEEFHRYFTRADVTQADFDKILQALQDLKNK